MATSFPSFLAKSDWRAEEYCSLETLRVWWIPLQRKEFPTPSKADNWQRKHLRNAALVLRRIAAFLEDPDLAPPVVVLLVSGGHTLLISMERVEEPAFTPEDRIGALELQNLNVGDNRALLLHHLEAVRALGRARPGAGLGALLGSGEKDEG